MVCVIDHTGQMGTITITAKADAFAAEKHRGQERRISKEPYVEHCRRVSRTVSLYTPDTNIIAAALLHDTLEDTETTYEELVKEFGAQVADMVRALTNDTHSA